MRHVLKMSLITAGATALMAGGVAQAQEGDGAAYGDGSEIVVTASKRDERLIDVPSAITAITNETIENLGIRDFRDYATLTPGLSQRDFGSPGQGTIILRGMNTGPQQTTNTAAFYIDDAPFSSNGFLSVGSLVTPSPDLVDVERIEVLKGPQGTLYGASSLGGIVRVLTQKADPTQYSGMAQVEGETLSHGGQGWAVRGAVNVPLIEDKLAIRASGFYRKIAGFTDNVTTGESDVNESRIRGGRIALRATPTERLTIDVNGFYQDISSDGAAAQDNVQGTTRPLYGRYRFARVADASGSEIKYRSVGGTIDYETEVGNIVAVANYIETKLASITDYTPIYGSYLTLLGILPAGTQTVGYLGPNLEKFSAELRFVSKRLGPVEFVAGAYYTHENSVYPFDIIARSPAGVPLPAPSNLVFRSQTTAIYDERAVFGNLTLYLTEQLDITGGIRYARNEQRTSGIDGVVFYAPRPAVSQPPFSDDATTYLATLRYRPSRNVSLFARVASGYRPGGPQNQTPFLPPDAQTRIRSDSVWNYEAGVKFTALDGALSGNLSAYRIDWSDIQLNTLFGGITLLGNAGTARIDGFEMELLARPSSNFTVGLNAGHTNARITRLDPTASTSLGANRGDKLPLTPPWQVAVFADHGIAFGETVKGSIGGTLRFQSDMPSSYTGTTLNTNVKVPSIATADLRAGIEFSQIKLQLRVDNVFDELGYSSLSTSAIYAGQPVATNATVIRPRSFILSATTRF